MNDPETRAAGPLEGNRYLPGAAFKPDIAPARSMVSYREAMPRQDPEQDEKRGLNRIWSGRMTSPFEHRKKHAMQPCSRMTVLLLSLGPWVFGGLLFGQELEPRAYASAPVGLHVLSATYSISDGSVVMDPTLPVEDVTATVSGTALGYFRGIDFFGRYGNVSFLVPYAWGSLEGLLDKEFTRITRSGLADPRFRLTFNLVGAPALKPREFAGYQQKTNLGLGFTVSAPLGQYDANKLINLGANRWAFKPELGLSHRQEKWLLELAGGAWLFSANNDYLGGLKRTQDPVLSLQGHVIYSLPGQTWLGFNANFFKGGKTFVDDAETTTPTLRNSRLGVTYSFPVHRRHSFKLSYEDGVLTSLGSDFSKFSVTYRFIWLGL